MDFDLFYSILSYISYFVSFLIFLHLVLYAKSTEHLLAWVALMLILPHIANILFFIFGIEWKRKKIFFATVEKNLENKEFFNLQKQIPYFHNELKTSHNKNLVKLMTLVSSSASSPLFLNGKVDFFFSGEEFFSKLIQSIKNAKKFIYMEFFIFRSDTIGSQIFDILCQKAKEGVEVSLLFDGIGSFGKISFKARRNLKKAGARFKFFLDPIFRLNQFYINYRNHRKLVVVDDKVVFIGGFNVGDEYLGRGKKQIKWRDTHAIVYGEAIRGLKEIFISDWINSNGEPLATFATPSSIYSKYSRLLTQIIVSGPDSDWNNIENCIHSAIYNAHSSICIESPYFIIDDSIQKALIVAALSGIDVSIIITGIPDKKILYWVAETYFEYLISAGVKIYRYMDGFLHSKMLIVDDYFAMIGSSNFDIRSFKLSYESNIIFYDETVVAKLRKQFEKDIKYSTQITQEFVNNQSMAKRLRNSILKIPSPLF